MTSAVVRLQPSVLSPQTELLKDDLELDTLPLHVKGVPALDIRPLLTLPANIERTIMGASTVTLTAEDPRDILANAGLLPSAVTFSQRAGRKLVSSGLLAANVDIRIDGLWFRLTAHRKQGNTITMTFEDREVALLRTYPSRLAPRHTWFKAVPVSRMSRVQFAEMLVREVRELPIRFYCPALNPRRAISNASDAPDTVTKQHERHPGFAPGADVTVKGAPADATQRSNIDRVLTTGHSMGARRKVLVCAIMTITQESGCRTSATNGVHVGLFQQNAADGWPATRVPEADAAAFFSAAISDDRKNPNIRYEQLCEDVQASGQGQLYGQWRTEAEHTVTAWGISGGDASNPTVPSTPLVGQGTAFQFVRGKRTVVNGQVLYTREDNWACLQRLAAEVNWRCFCVSGTVYFITDADLFASAPRMRVSEDAEGIDSVDWDFTTGKRRATITVPCRIGRWQAPPGTTIEISDMLPLNGRWLVQTVQRDVFTPAGTVTAEKPEPVLPEALSPEYTATGVLPLSAAFSLSGGGAGATVDGAAVVAAAQQALANRADYRYQQVRPMPNSLFSKPFPKYIDCSAFATLCYKAAGAQDPNRLGYNGEGYTGTLVKNGTWTKNPVPGDLCFYGSNRSVPEHVAIYIGNGECISMGSPGDPSQLRVDGMGLPFLGFMTYVDQGRTAAQKAADKFHTHR